MIRERSTFYELLLYEQRARKIRVVKLMEDIFTFSAIFDVSALFWRSNTRHIYLQWLNIDSSRYFYYGFNQLVYHVRYFKNIIWVFQIYLETIKFIEISLKDFCFLWNWNFFGKQHDFFDIIFSNARASSMIIFF